MHQAYHELYRFFGKHESGVNVGTGSPVYSKFHKDHHSGIVLSSFHHNTENYYDLHGDIGHKTFMKMRNKKFLQC